MDLARSADIGPLDPARRNVAIDALRGVALCGIVLVNVIAMGGPIGMERPPTVPTFADTDWLVWTIAQLFVTGTMRGLFSMLFGVGLLLFLDRDPAHDRGALYLRRLAWLFVFGLIDSIFLLWPGDILVVYAIAGVFVMISHRVSSRSLMSMAALILLLVSAWEAYEVAGLHYADTIYSSAMLLREAQARLGSYADNQAYMAFVAWAWTIDAITLRSIGDAAAFMLIGIVLHRRGVFARDGDPRLLGWLMALGYTLGLGLRIVHTVSTLDNHGVPTILSAALDQPGRLAMTIGHIALFMRLWRRWGSRLVFVPFARMGRMALTLYLGQSVAGALIFSGFGLGLWNNLSWAERWEVGMLVIAAQAILATAWLQYFRYGPVEWLWRWGTYGRLPLRNR